MFKSLYQGLNVRKGIRLVVIRYPVCVVTEFVTCATYNSQLCNRVVFAASKSYHNIFWSLLIRTAIHRVFQKMASYCNSVFEATQ